MSVTIYSLEEMTAHTQLVEYLNDTHPVPSWNELGLEQNIMQPKLDQTFHTELFELLNPLIDEMREKHNLPQTIAQTWLNHMGSRSYLVDHSHFGSTIILYYQCSKDIVGGDFRAMNSHIKPQEGMAIVMGRYEKHFVDLIQKGSRSSLVVEFYHPQK